MKVITQLIYVAIHLLFAAVVMITGTLALLGKNLIPNTAGGLILCAASATLIFHAAMAFRSDK